MTPREIESEGDALHQARLERRTLAPLVDRWPGIGIEDAYRVQQRMVARRLEAGETITGKKIGVTSKAVQLMVGVSQPDFGQLTSGMAYHEGEVLPLGHLIQPKAEAEVAFILKRDLKGPGVTATDVITATDYVSPCFEIVDSRITDWKIKIQDTIADNASCGVYLIGKARKKLSELDLNLAGMVLERNGELIDTSAGAAVQGGPVNAVVWLANTLGVLGISLLAGEVILSGSQSALYPAVAGEVLKCTVGGLGSCEVRFFGRRRMSLSRQIIEQLADEVMHAQDHAHTIGKLTDAHPEMTIEDAYAVQDVMRERRVARGDRLVGMKAGLTSKAKMQQMSVHVPSFGMLMASTARPENGAIEMAGLIHPRVEAEIAFVLKADLGGGDCSIEEVIEATDYIIPAVEVIDSRFERFKFDLISATADNGSACRYVTGGRPLDPRGVDLRTIGVVIEKNGEIAALGASAAVLNHPANAIVMLARHLAERGRSLPAGSFIMTGGITEAIAVNAGDSIVARFQYMGSVSMRFV